MKRFLPILFVLLIPAMAFAQARKMDEGTMLKNLGLSDTQVSQVTTLQRSTREATRADLTHIRLIQAQIAEALLPASPDAQAINALIEKKGQLRVDIEKNRMAARIQLEKIVGPDNFSKIARYIGERRMHRFQRRGENGQIGRPMFVPENGAQSG